LVYDEEGKFLIWLSEREFVVRTCLLAMKQKVHCKSQLQPTLAFDVSAEIFAVLSRLAK